VYRSAALHAENCVGVLTPPGARDIRGSIYFLHGGDGTDEQFLQAGLEACLSATRVAALSARGIQIVLPNIGLSFLRSPSDPSLPSHWHALMNEVMPAMEAETAVTPERRWITGISMGGNAALSAFFRRPDLFGGCGTLFPGVVDFDPFSETALLHHAERTQISDTHRGILSGCFRSAFADADEYARHDPIALAAHVNPSVLVGKRIHLEVGAEDEFGLHVGVTRLAALCADRGIVSSIRVIPHGRHDAAFLHQRVDPMLHEMLTV
jgi:S-formylglutathione hydrolase FrmB